MAGIVKKGETIGIGIVAIVTDLGTTYSCVGVWKGDRVEIVANDQGHRTTPSYVAFTDAERLIGDPAKSQAAKNPRNTIFDAKRLIGRKITDPSVQEDIRQWPFLVNGDENNNPLIQAKYKGKKESFKPEQISSMVLSKMKSVAEAFLGKEVTSAVITVPAYFNDAQRQATKDAGTIAGLNVLRIINEPTAAALAYGLDKLDQKKTILIFDLGGGTFDVSLLQIEDGLFQVKATAGDTHLGGEDFDNILVQHFVKEVQRKLRKDISKDDRAMRRLRTACEELKRSLSSTSESSIEIDGLVDGEDFSSKLSRAKFESLCLDLFKKTLEPVKKVLSDGKVTKEDIDDIVLVGGSTRIPKVQSLLMDFFDGKQLSQSINPDEAVAYGAATQGAILSGEAEKSGQLCEVLLCDITAMSLGIEVIGGWMSNIIDRNSSIPASKTGPYSTVEDNQEIMLIKVYEGENEKTAKNNLLGEFELTGIPRMPKGEPEIRVTFSLDSNGILNASAVEVSTKSRNEITIRNISRMSGKEIKALTAIASRFQTDDEANQDRLAAKSDLEEYCFDMQEKLDEMEDVPDKTKALLEKSIDRVLVWIEKNPTAGPGQFQKKHSSLQKEVDSQLASLRL